MESAESPVLASRSLAVAASTEIGVYRSNVVSSG